MNRQAKIAVSALAVFLAACAVMAYMDRAPHWLGCPNATYRVQRPPISGGDLSQPEGKLFAAEIERVNQSLPIVTTAKWEAPADVIAAQHIGHTNTTHAAGEILMAAQRKEGPPNPPGPRVAAQRKENPFGTPTGPRITAQDQKLILARINGWRMD